MSSYSGDKRIGDLMGQLSKLVVAKESDLLDELLEGMKAINGRSAMPFEQRVVMTMQALSGRHERELAMWLALMLEREVDRAVLDEGVPQEKK